LSKKLQNRDPELYKEVITERNLKVSTKEGTEIIMIITEMTLGIFKASGKM